jgi:4-amino-4-deoxychorismate lyase
VSLETAFWLDGTPTSVLPLPDRGLDYGDGLFETLLVHQGKALYTEMHLERMSEGLLALALPDCLTAVTQQLDRVLLDASHLVRPWAVLRISVIRGPGRRGYAPSSASPRILIGVTGLDRDCAQMASVATLGLATIRLSSQPQLARIKHLNRLEQVLAAAQAQTQCVDECIMLDGTDHITSVTAGNLFLVRHGELLTPKLNDCGVSGTRRRLIMENWAPSIGLTVREGSLTLADMEAAEEVFYSNSLLTVRPVARLSGISWDNHTICNALFECFRGELA